MAQSHIKHTTHLINLQDILAVFLDELNLCCRQFVCKFVCHAVAMCPAWTHHQLWGLRGLHPAYCGLWAMVTEVFCWYENMTVIHKASQQDIPLSGDISEGCSSRMRGSSLQLSLRSVGTTLSGTWCSCWDFHVHWTRWSLWISPSPIHSLIL